MHDFAEDSKLQTLLDGAKEARTLKHIIIIDEEPTEHDHALAAAARKVRFCACDVLVMNECMYMLR